MAVAPAPAPTHSSSKPGRPGEDDGYVPVASLLPLQPTRPHLRLYKGEDLSDPERARVFDPRARLSTYVARDRNVEMWITAAVLTFLGGTGLGVWYRSWRRRMIQKRRVVEQPNSHFSSEQVRRRERQHRWQRIDLGRVHPLNREEVRRLRAIAEHVGMGALTSRDQEFLDNMSDGRFS